MHEAGHMRLRTGDVEETRALGEALASVIVRGDVIVLAGNLGSGKTQLAQGIGRGLGVADRVVSPSFVIVREYEGRIPLVHVDIYRLDHVQELHDLGFEEVLDPGRVTLIEWGDRVEGLLPDNRLEMRLRVGTSASTRTIECNIRGPRWAARTGALTRALEQWADADTVEPAGDVPC